MSYDYTAPWTVPPYIGVGWDVVDANGVNVAQYIQEEECARLIAAAPEMYGLLYEALQELKHNMLKEYDTSSVWPCIKELLNRIDGEEDNE